MPHRFPDNQGPSSARGRRDSCATPSAFVLERLYCSPPQAPPELMQAGVHDMAVRASRARSTTSSCSTPRVIGGRTQRDRAGDRCVAVSAHAVTEPPATLVTHGRDVMPTTKTKDNAEIYYKDWGTGQPVVFSHGWPLSADAWEDQMFFLASQGYRCIAHDRRGHGRSSQPLTGNDIETYADDLAALVEALDLKAAVHVGHSTGGGEVARYIGKYGGKRVAGAALVSAITPLMLKTPANPEGTPIEAFDQIRAGVLADRSQYFKDLAIPFYGANRPGSKVSEGLRESFWLQGMMAGLPAAYDCIKAFSETDLTEDLKKFDGPTLIVHGDDDQIVPIRAAALKAVKLVKGAELKVYEGAPHGLPSTEKNRLNRDLLDFIKSLSLVAAR
jgi:non-heme chloroperoxidase